MTELLFAGQSEQPCVSAFRAMSRGIAIVVALVASMVLLGWVFDIHSFKNILPGYATMKVNTAVCLLLSGVSLRLAGITPENRTARLAMQLCAAIVALMSSLTMSEYWIAWNPGLDQFLYHDPMSSGRMASATALNLFLVSFGLLLLDVKIPSAHRLAEFSVLLATLLSFVAILGYIFGVKSLYQVDPYATMAPHTAACLALLGVGILFARPERGIMAVIAADSLGGKMARWFLPVVVVVLTISGWITVRGLQAGLYGAEFAIAMLTAVNIVIFCFFSWWFAWGLHQADTDRRRAHAETIALNEGLESRVIERTAELEKTFRALRSSEEKFRAVAETANEAFISADCQGNVIHWNRGAEQIFGYTFAEMLGEPLVTIMPQRFRVAHQHGVQRFLATGEAVVVGKTVELAGQRKDGSEFPLELSLADWTTADGKFFTGVIRDISDRKRAEEELTKRASELARSNRELEDFAFVASHDLQEPLRMISSYSQLLSKRYRDKLGSDADDFIGFIVGGATRMQRLIEDLLQYARITTKGNSFALVSIQEVVDQTVANLRPLIAESNATITLDPLPTINGDDVQLGQLFQNLIGNAIKYHGPEPPVIRVSSQWNGREWLFSVSDNGIGIEPMNQDKIFVIFQRLHGRSEYEGTGIGLAVCKKIVERHGGNIWVDSKLGEGSTFCFALPGEST